MVSHAFFTTLVRGPNAQIVFGFEFVSFFFYYRSKIVQFRYAVLMTMVLHVTIKYILHMHDLRSAVQWESKTVYMLYTELLISRFYGIPTVCPGKCVKNFNRRPTEVIYQVLNCSGGLRCGIYMLFVAIMLRVHTVPLFAVRPFYLALRDFKKALSDVLLSRRAINAMNKYSFPFLEYMRARNEL